MADAEWPDRLDVETGLFTYYGDNKTPGTKLHETARRGNHVLRELFSRAHGSRDDRSTVPPVFVFTKAVSGRDVVFRGIAVPGAIGVGASEDLVAIWKTRNGHRFQNYRALFSILDIPEVSRDWLTAIRLGAGIDHAPQTWLDWQAFGQIRPLAAPRAKEHRSPAEQLPESAADIAFTERDR